MLGDILKPFIGRRLAFRIALDLILRLKDGFSAMPLFSSKKIKNRRSGFLEIGPGPESDKKCPLRLS
jgi:hypothetical protein